MSSFSGESEIDRQRRRYTTVHPCNQPSPNLDTACFRTRLWFHSTHRPPGGCLKSPIWRPDLGREEVLLYHKLYPRLFIYVNCFYSTCHKSAGAAVTLCTGEKSKLQRLCWLCLRQGLPRANAGGPEAHVGSSRKELRPSLGLAALGMSLG